VNPIGGDGRGRKIVAKEVEPALRRAGLVPEVYLTKGRGDAFNVGKTHDLGYYWALVRRRVCGLGYAWVARLRARDARLSLRLVLGRSR